MVPIRKTMRVRQLNLEGEPSTLQEETKVGLETSPYESRTISSGKSQESQTGLEVSPHESLTISPSKFLAGACIRCKMLKVKCSHDAGAESCRRCLLGGFKCVVPDRKKRISEGIQPDTFSLPSSLGEPDIKTGYFGDFSEKLAVPNRGLANDKTSEPFQTGRDPKVQSQAFPTPADDLLVNLDENALWFESDRYITADEAFAFVSDLEIPLRIAFADVKFRGQYKIQVGFDESMLRQGMLVEEVYLLLDVGLQVPVHDVCNTFTAIFAPFPAIVYTPEQTYYLPVDPQEQSGRGMKALGEFRTRGRGSGSSGNRPGTGVAHSGKGSSNDGTNRRGNRSDRDRGIEKDHKGARESEGEEDGDEDDDDKPNPGGGKTESRSLGKRARRGAQIVNIPFGSTLSIAGIDGSHRVNTVASVDIMVSLTLSLNQISGFILLLLVKIDKNEHGTSPPPDSRWSGPWFGVDMTGLEVSSIFVDRPAYLLSLAQVQVMACSPEPVVLLDRSPQHLHTEGDSVKHTVTRNAGFSLGAMLSASPSVQAQYSAGEASGTEKRMRRWDVGSYKILDETQLEGESDGAVWKYIHNDAIFGRVEGWSFDHELRPSAVFGFSDVKPEVEVQVVAFWSSEAHTKLMKPRDSFPFRWRRAKEQQSVFANFVYQVAVVVDLEKVQDERSWIMPRKQLDSVKRNELSGTKGPIHFNPITAMAKMHSEGQMEEVVSAGWDVSITRGVDERPGLTAPERTGDRHAVQHLLEADILGRRGTPHASTSYGGFRTLQLAYAYTFTFAFPPTHRNAGKEGTQIPSPIPLKSLYRIG